MPATWPVTRAATTLELDVTHDETRHALPATRAATSLTRDVTHAATRHISADSTGWQNVESEPFHGWFLFFFLLFVLLIFFIIKATNKYFFLSFFHIVLMQTGRRLRSAAWNIFLLIARFGNVSKFKIKRWIMYLFIGLLAGT